MGAVLNVQGANLEALGGVITAAAPLVAPPPPIIAPASDPTSILTTHGLATQGADTGARSAVLAAMTTATGGLAQATGATYTMQETLNAGPLGGGGQGGLAGPPARMDVPPAPVPPAPDLPPVALPTTDPLERTTQAHTGPGSGALIAGAAWAETMSAQHTDSATQLLSANASMADVWDSDASTQAQAFISQLVEGHTITAGHFSTLARNLRQQGENFDMLQSEMPTPAQYLSAKARADAAERVNEMFPGQYTDAVVATRRDFAEVVNKINTASKNYDVRSAAVTGPPSSQQNSPGGPQPGIDDVIVPGDNGTGHVQLAGFGNGGAPLDPPPAPAPPPPAVPWPPPGGPPPAVKYDPSPQPPTAIDMSAPPAPPPGPPSPFIQQWEQSITAPAPGASPIAPPMPRSPSGPVMGPAPGPAPATGPVPTEMNPDWGTLLGSMGAGCVSGIGGGAVAGAPLPPAEGITIPGGCLGGALIGGGGYLSGIWLHNMFEGLG